MTAPAWSVKPPWLPVDAPVQGVPGIRTPEAYLDVCKQFDVEKNPRYAPKAGKTYCNIYVWDCTKALGCEIPHWFHPVTGQPTAVSAGAEMRANDMFGWLTVHGSEAGWSPMSPLDASWRANRGDPTVILWRNPRGIGHVAMLLPDDLIAQAGGTNLWRARVEEGFGTSHPLHFFSHA